MDDRIQGNDSIKELGEQIEGFMELKSFAETLGIKLDGIEELDEIGKQFQELSNLPDDFNSIYSNNGWIAHESMDAGVMKKAIKIGKKSYLDGEKILISYYEDLIQGFINRISYQPLYQDRSEMLHFAVEDYKHERYYSTILIMLTQLDGIVNDIKYTGLFADSTDLEIWDSISGHSSGLKKIVDIFKTNRTKTSTEPIELPYRNGILHGRELNYNSRLLATKTLALLIYVHDWYIVARDEERRKRLFEEEQVRKSETTLKDVLMQYDDHRTKMEQLDKLQAEWSPRSPEEMNLIELKIGTPEFAANQFFEYIKNKNFGKPVEFYAKNLFKKISVKVKAGKFREEYSEIDIQDFSVSSVIDTGSAVSEVEMSIQYLVQEESKQTNMKL